MTLCTFQMFTTHEEDCPGVLDLSITPLRARSPSPNKWCSEIWFPPLISPELLPKANIAAVQQRTKHLLGNILVDYVEQILQRLTVEIVKLHLGWPETGSKKVG